MDADSQQFDIVVFGATSFVGQILTEYLVKECPGDSGIRWAIAGRNRAKLASVAAKTGADRCAADGGAVEQLVVDADDDVALAEMCSRTKLVISTVGPYALYGSKLVAAVVAAGIDYCDLTGEPQWMQRMIDSRHERAVSTGARVVHACGFDSVPSDMGVWFLQQHALEKFGEPCTAIRMGVKAAKGGASGGTFASMMNLVEEVSTDKSLRKVLANPYALAPKSHRTGPKSPGPKQPDVTMPVFNEGLNSWEAPFVMAATNSRVVLRSHALLNHPWGNDFTYGESMLTGNGPVGRAKALAVAAGTGAFVGLVALGPTRSLLGRVLPAPGEGPSPQTQQNGFFDLRFHGTTDGGSEVTVKVTGDRDPGYGSTAKMLGQAALVLLQSDVGGGFWTPSTALGEAYKEALVDRAGLTFEVL